MAKKDDNKNRKKDKNKGKRLDISAIGVVDNLVFSDKEVWAYYSIGGNAYDFLSHDGKLALAANTTNAFANLMTDRAEPLDAHIINFSKPLDTDAWEQQMYDEIIDGREPPGLNDFIQDQKYYLESREYYMHVSYLGICIGRRGALEMESLNLIDAGFKGAWEELKKWGKKAMSMPGVEIGIDEELRFRKAEEEFYTILSQGHLNAQRVSSEDLLLTMKQQFYPGMPTPYLDVDHDNRLGPGDLELELYSGIKNRYRWMEFTQQILQYTVTGYRATLTFSKFPKEILYPAGIPFLYLPTRLDEPYDTYARFTLIPTENMKKEVVKKQKELDDELQNIGEAGGDSMVNTHAEAGEALEDSVMLDSILSSDKTPWLQGTYRIVIEDSTEEGLKEQVAKIRQDYSDMGININHTAGDQAELFLEQMPGDRLRESSFQQTTNLYQIGASGFNFSSAVGDRIKGRELRK